MIRAATPLALASCILAGALADGCAAPGDPIPRHPVVPTAVKDLAASQYGNAFALTFTLPSRSLDRESLAEHPTIEIYRAMLAPGAVPDKNTAWQPAYAIPSEQVERYLREDRIEFHDVLGPESFALAPGSSVAYKVRTRAAKTRASGDSNVVTARIYPPPEAPRGVRASVTESAVVVSWAEAALPPGASSLAYRVYRGVLETGQENPPPDLSQAKLKTPLEPAGSVPSAEYRDVNFALGTAYLYTVHTVAQFGADFVESADSAPVAVTPRDIFPPAAPANLEITIVPATGQTPAYVELSWAISSEADLAGYTVYRSDREDVDGERVSPERLLSPAFRDLSVEPGRRYYYRVAALDRAGNESTKSSAAVADVP